MIENVDQAVELATHLHLKYADQATEYRSQYIDMILVFATGLGAALGFWLNLKKRKHLFPAFALFATGLGAFVLLFQLYWYQYNHISWRWSVEYRQEAFKLLRGERDEIFAGHDCGSDTISWKERKRREVVNHWNGADTDLCTKTEAKLFSSEQRNVWTFFILIYCGAAVAIAFRTRKGEGDGESNGVLISKRSV